MGEGRAGVRNLWSRAPQPPKRFQFGSPVLCRFWLAPRRQPWQRTIPLNPAFPVQIRTCTGYPVVAACPSQKPPDKSCQPPAPVVDPERFTARPQSPTGARLWAFAAASHGSPPPSKTLRGAGSGLASSRTRQSEGKNPTACLGTACAHCARANVSGAAQIERCCRVR